MQVMSASVVCASQRRKAWLRAALYISPLFFVNRKQPAHMKFDPQKHHRRSIRLQGYDYSQAGAYFVTVVAWQRECLFGKIVDGVMVWNDFGRIIQEE